jgi:hypothetical protein
MINSSQHFFLAVAKLLAAVFLIGCMSQRGGGHSSSAGSADVIDAAGWGQFHSMVASARQCRTSSARNLLAASSTEGPRSAEYEEALSEALEFFARDRPKCFAAAFLAISPEAQEHVRRRLRTPLYSDPMIVGEDGIPNGCLESKCGSVARSRRNDDLSGD